MITMTLELLHSAGVFGYGQCGDTLDSDFVAHSRHPQYSQSSGLFIIYFTCFEACRIHLVKHFVYVPLLQTPKAERSGNNKIKVADFRTLGPPLPC